MFPGGLGVLILILGIPTISVLCIKLWIEWEISKSEFKKQKSKKKHPFSEGKVGSHPHDRFVNGIHD